MTRDGHILRLRRGQQARERSDTTSRFFSATSLQDFVAFPRPLLPPIRHNEPLSEGLSGCRNQSPTPVPKTNWKSRCSRHLPWKALRPLPQLSHPEPRCGTLPQTFLRYDLQHILFQPRGNGRADRRQLHSFSLLFELHTQPFAPATPLTVVALRTSRNHVNLLPPSHKNSCNILSTTQPMFFPVQVLSSNSLSFESFCCVRV